MKLLLNGGFMKKQLFLSVLIVGLIGGYTQAVDANRLIEAIKSGDVQIFEYRAEDLLKGGEQQSLITQVRS